MQLLGEMWRSRLEPNVISYSSATSACEKGQQWEQALSLLPEMQSSRLEPDVISYSSAISACEVCGRSADSLQLWRRLLDADVIPDVATFNAAVGVLEVELQRECFSSVVDGLEELAGFRGRVSFGRNAMAPGAAAMPEETGV